MSPLVRWLRIVLLVVLATLLSPLARAASDGAVSVAALPTWVVHLDAEGAFPEGELHDGAYVLLSDVQRRVGATTETYFHRARKVLTPSAVATFAQVVVELRPAYERLAFHSVRIRRGAESIDALRRDAIKVLDSESEADALIYRGTATARLILEDVRVGDIIDVEYTVSGANPVFEGKAYGAFDLAYPHPVHRLHRRLLTPRDRDIPHRLLGTTTEPSLAIDGDTTVRTWDLRNVPAIVHEDLLPESYDPRVSVQWSELPTWREVVALAAPMYAARDELDKELAARVESIRASAPTDEAKVLAALKLVQSEVRYLGLELGTSSHKPASASVVFKRRFGDCKDKTILLVTILRALGIDAQPAFVNTKAQGEIERWLPSPLAFDHVIVRARVNGATLWLDGTISSEDGALDKRVAPPFGRALVVAGTTDALTPIERTRPSEPLVSIHEEYTVRDYTSPATLTVRSVYRGADADYWRERLTSEPRSDLERELLNFYAKRDLDIVQLAPARFEDDRARNTLTIIEQYRLPTFFRADTRYFSPYALDVALRKPHVVRRTLPFAVRYPFNAEHVTRVVLPGKYDAKRETRGLADATFKYNVDVDAVENVVTIRSTLETLRDTVPASETEDYLKMIDRIDEHFAYGVDKRGMAVVAKKKSSGKEFLVLLGVLSVIGAVFLARNALRWARRARWKRSHKARTGEVPALAVRVATEAEMLAHIERLRCSCGARWSDHGGQRIWSEASLEGRNLAAVRTSCPSCGEWTRCWFDRSAFTARNP